MLMSSIKRASFAAIASACLIGSATAADMTGAQIKELMGHAVPLQDFSAALDNPNFYFDTDHLNRARDATG